MKRLLHKKNQKVFLVIFSLIIILTIVFLISKDKKEGIELKSLSIFETEAAKEYAEKSSDNLSLVGKMYSDSKTGFSFRVPEKFSVGVFEDEEGKTYVVQNAQQGVGFQVYASSFDELSISAERIKKDIPDMNIKNAKTIKVFGADALYFESNSSIFGGASAEVWWVRNGSLYQMSSYLIQKELVKAVAQTIEFK